MRGNASPEANCEFDQIAREIVAEAKATDEADDERYGEARGDELPEQLRTAEGRREFLREAKRRLRGDPGTDELTEEEPIEETAAEEFEFDADRIVARGPGSGGLVARSKASARAWPLAGR